MALNLADIVKKRTGKPPTIVIYGVGGIGKSTFASKAPKVFFVLTEDGVGEDVQALPLCKSYDDVVSQLELLLSDTHDYKFVALDSLDRTEQLIFKHVCQEDGDGKKESVEDFGYGKGYALAQKYWLEILGLLERLRDEKKMGVILIGHSLIKSFNPPDAEPYDRYRFDLHDKSASLIRNWADIVLFANYKLPEFSQDKVTRALTEPQRVIYTAERPAFWAKTRRNLPFELKLDWTDFMEALKNGANTTAKRSGDNAPS